MHIYDELNWRGLVHQVSDEAGVREYLNTPGRSLYCGFDPTAPSLHIGNMVPLIALLRFARAGHNPLFLVGMATSMIGDPSGKDAERQMLPVETIEANIANIKGQVERVFGGDVTFVNNHDWFGPMTTLEFLRDVGKHYSVNWMLAKESVKNRIGREETGISFTEFSYMLLQGYDFYRLYEDRGCRLQIGGSDQWGNITSGTELIRRKTAHTNGHEGGDAYALTFPLITTADGKKFGKSEKGAIYLDTSLTSVWDFYQYFVRSDDRDVVQFLKYFTFLSQGEVDELAAAHEAAPHKREAHTRLAQEMTRLVHGEAELAKVEQAAAVLYGDADIREADPDTLAAALGEVPSITVADASACADLPALLAELGLTKSKGEARKAIASGGVYANMQRVEPDAAIGAEDFLHGRLLVLRKGKKHYGVVRLAG